MMSSPIFRADRHLDIQRRVADLINRSPDFLSVNTARSPRAAGDAIEAIIAESFDTIVGDLGTDYSASFARRAMADLAFKDREGGYYIVDVKTHRIDTKFNMPNLTSVERLARYYEDDSNYFTLLMVSYAVDGVRATVSDVKFVPIEYLDWSCLTIGALGWGQIQIANSNNIVVDSESSRKQWMLALCDALLEFYPKEIAKITDRIDRFERVREFWRQKPEG